MELPWRLLFPVVLAGSVACGYDGSAPDESETLYVLRRIGHRALPAPRYPGSESPLMVADSIHLPRRLVPDKLLTLQRAQVLQDHGGQVHHFGGRFHASLTSNRLTIDNCPIDAACFASLLYDATTLLVTGDSLFEVVGPQHPIGPRVYGRVRR